MPVQEKEAVMFMMTMSDTMRFLMPAPVEMDSMDEYKDNDEIKSRLALCSDLVRMMVNQMSGLPIDVFFAKNSGNGVAVAHGNAKDHIHPIINALKSLSTQTRSNGMCNPEFVLREFDKLITKGEFAQSRMHWFIDAENFLKFDPSFIHRRFKNLTIYVVGELRTIHNDYDEAKKACVSWTRDLGSTVRLLLCGADVDEFKREILTEKRFEIREKSVTCLLGKDKFRMKLHAKLAFGSADWPCDNVAIVGFLPEIELSRLSVLAQQYNAGDIYSVSAKTDNGNEILWSMANFMLTDPKSSFTCLCRCMRGSELLEYGVLVADSTDGSIGLSLLRIVSLPKHEILNLKAVTALGEASEKLPDDTHPQFAPMDHRMIKKRLSDIEESSEGDCVGKRMKFEALSDEYQVLGADEEFDTFTATWQKEHL